MSQAESATKNNASDGWDAGLYDTRHSYVTRYGDDVAELLAPKPGDRILDLGCGTGHLTQKIAETGATVVGLDSSAEMVAEARKAYPHLSFHHEDAADFRFEEPFDAVFSNAALHWMKPPERVAECVSRSLKEGGRFVAEMGGKGNVASVIRASRNALGEIGLSIKAEDLPWYFPSIAEYGTLLERHGISLTFAVTFPRPTRVDGGEDGLRSWMSVFGKQLLASVPEDRVNLVLQAVEEELRSTAYHDDAWWVDYRRLRFVAVKAPTQEYG